MDKKRSTKSLDNKFNELTLIDDRMILGDGKDKSYLGI